MKVLATAVRALEISSEVDMMARARMAETREVAADRINKLGTAAVRTAAAQESGTEAARTVAADKIKKSNVCRRYPRPR